MFTVANAPSGNVNDSPPGRNGHRSPALFQQTHLKKSAADRQTTARAALLVVLFYSSVFTLASGVSLIRRRTAEAPSGTSNLSCRRCRAHNAASLMT